MEFYSYVFYFCYVVFFFLFLFILFFIEMEEFFILFFYRELGKLFDRDSCEYLIYYVGYIVDNKYIYCLLFFVD